jgi:predicted choloylglycine hydrolase
MKTKKLLISIITVLICCLCFIFGGCQKEDKATVYKAHHVVDANTGEILYQLGDTYGSYLLTEDVFVVTLKESGKAIISRPYFGTAQATSWKQVAEEYIVIVTDGFEQAYGYTGDTIIVFNGDTNIILVKE